MSEMTVDKFDELLYNLETVVREESCGAEDLHKKLLAEYQRVCSERDVRHKHERNCELVLQMPHPMTPQIASAALIMDDGHFVQWRE